MRAEGHMRCETREGDVEVGWQDEYDPVDVTRDGGGP